jgi:hypothetical protein
MTRLATLALLLALTAFGAAVFTHAASVAERETAEWRQF